MPSAIIFGATGATGKHVLRTLLSTKEFTKVGEYGRRVTALDTLPNEEGLDKAKLVQKVVDMEKLENEQDLKQDWDVIFITLGTTRAIAGSAEAFEKIDREYVLSAARQVKTKETQRIVYVSSAGANRNSMFLYPRSKGLTEDGLAALGYNDTIIFRPGALAERGSFELGGYIANGVLGAIPFFNEKLQIKVSDLGKAVVRAGLLGSSSLPSDVEATEVKATESKFTLIGNRGALRLARASL
ncbi:Protein fmp52, mitochondrial [Serendipita sp. 411]|nr:Protein fmp52, mitochondrial [Serendipita sp. 401]KAG8812091.1 Protein fmp52, mitochondrial [Serendipita sp. 400]KAG8844053.1 Protein fmp52, mitochondrial [Serendipita sp. 411]